MSNPVRLVIFDCDGVLVDSERITVRIDVAVLAQLGWALTEDEVLERFLGRTDEYMASQIEAHLGRPLAAAVGLVLVSGHAHPLAVVCGLSVLPVVVVAHGLRGVRAEA